MTGLSDAAVERLRGVMRAVDFEHPRYALAELLGQGGMGAVYRAHDRELARDVALKLIDSPAPPPDAEERLLEEARILARLEHPGIVPVHDVGRLADGRVFCVMKRVDGRRLDDPGVAAAPLHDRLRIFERICEAAAFAHARGVVHRDLKPSNVMVGAFGEVLVLDWGLARVMAAEAPAPGVARSVAGTEGYMAPEQAADGSGVVDGRSDVFALGGLLMFLLTGAHPPAAGPAAGPAPGPAMNSAPPPDRRLLAIAHRARAEAAGERYASVAELAADVARWRAGEPVTAYRENALEQARRFVQRYQVAIVLVGAYLLMRWLLFFFARR